MKPYLISGIIAVMIIAIMIIAFPNGCKRNDTKLEKQVKELTEQKNALQKKVDSTAKVNEGLVVLASRHEKRADSLIKADAVLAEKYKKNLKEIEKIKYEYQKLQGIDKYSSADIMTWFANNYPPPADSTLIDSSFVDSLTSVPNSQLRPAIKDVEIGKITQKELVATRVSVDILSSRIVTKDSTIISYQKSDSLYKKAYTNTLIMVTDLQHEVSLQKEISDTHEKKAKRRGFWNKVLLVVTIGLTGAVLAK